jgi:hypothetical protein
MPGAACGREATSRRGYIGPASEPAASRPDVRTTQTRILKNARPPLRLQIFCTTNADRRDVARLVRAQAGR